MEENGDEKLLAVARHIAKTLGRTDTMTDDILQIFSTFDRRFSKMSEKSNGDDDSTGSLAVVDQTLRSLERRISRFVSADRPIWSDTAASAAFLDAIDELVAALREWELSAPDAELSELLSRAEGLLQQAMFRLEEEFRELVDSYSNSLESSNSFSSSAPYGSFDPSHSLDSDSEEEGSGIPTARPLPDYDFVIDAMPSGTIADLHEIAKRMVPAGYGKECSRVYASCRGGFLEESLSRLGLEKRSIEEVQKIPWAQVEDDIHRWMKIANVAFRILFPSERRLIDRVLSDLPQSFSDITFMEVCRVSVIRVLNFADAIAIDSRSPERLFRVLDLFETMRDLMPEISSVFSDGNCVSIRVEALAVWKRLGESIRAMFVELENLIKRDPAKATVPGGGLHPITRYVMNYLVAGSASCRTLEQALQIANHDGNGGQFELEDTTPTTSSALSSEISWIIELLQSNLEAKSKMYRDPALSSIFLMNNNRYIAQKVRNSELRTIVGDDWVRKQKAKVRQHHVSYQRVAWGRILATLRVDGSSIPNAASGVRGAARERLKQFNAGLEEACKAQREWVVVEDQIREELRISVAENLIPAYRSFLGRYQHVLEDGKHVDKHLKYSLEDVEAKVNELFLRRK